MTARRKHTYGRIFQGRRPSEYDHPILLAVFEGFPCPVGGEGRQETWQLWLRAARSTASSWWNMKLCAAAPKGELAGTAYLKANYWLGWHRFQRRFPVRSSDHGKLRDGRPELYSALCYSLIGHIAATIEVIAGAVQIRDGFAPRGQLAQLLPLVISHKDRRATGNTHDGPATALEPDADEDLL
jgi:hypothetical protein